MHHPYAARDQHWTLIIPVKETMAAKTRLSRFDQAARAALALAFAHDAAAAAADCSWVNRVVAVTNDVVVARSLASLGVEIVADQPGAGQNPALRHAASILRSLDDDVSVVAMSSDLPAVRSSDLNRAFGAAGGLSRWFVSDTEGEGTTLLASTAGASFEPLFGPASCRRHRDSGAVELPGDQLERLRRDVDTEAHLSAAVDLGVGVETQAALGRLQIACGA